VLRDSGFATVRVTGTRRLYQVDAAPLRDIDDWLELELVHAGIETPERWAEFGPGATGVGWDLALLGLNQYLGGELVADPADWEASPEIVEYSRRSAWAWADAHRAAGGPADEAEAAARNTAKFSTGT